MPRKSPYELSLTSEQRAELEARARKYTLPEHSAAPFEWKFTRSDLTKLLERLADKPDYPAAA